MASSRYASSFSFDVDVSGVLIAWSGGSGVLWRLRGTACKGADVMVKPPGLGRPGTKTSSHCPGRNFTAARKVVELAYALDLPVAFGKGKWFIRRQTLTPRA